MADKGAFTVYTATFTKFLAYCKDSAKLCSGCQKKKRMCIACLDVVLHEDMPTHADIYPKMEIE